MKGKTFIGGIIIMLLYSIIFSACSIQIDDNSDPSHIHSREYVEKYCSSNNFGGGRTDDTYVALNYIYNNEELKVKYGDSFEVDDIGGSSDCQSFMFLQIIKGTGKYFVDIGEDEWAVELSKEYFGKWQISKCYQN